MTEIVDKAELRRLLNLFPIKIIRQIAYTKDLKFKSQECELIVEKLLELKWTSTELTKLKSLYFSIQREREGISCYILNLKMAYGSTNLLDRISSIPVELNVDGNVENQGFKDIKYDKNTDTIECVHLRHTIKEEILPNFEKKFILGNPQVHLKIDSKENRIIFFSHSYGDIQATKAFLSTTLGIEFDSSKITDLDSKQTKDKFESLVTTIEKRIGE